jgi:hypothetical protein
MGRKQDYYEVAERPRRGFFSTVARGVAVILVVGIVCGTTVVLYGMNIADRRTSDFIALTGDAFEHLPELAENLPPVLGDLLNHERRPEYAEKIRIVGRLAEEPDSNEGEVVYRPVFDVKNEGDKVVSALAMHVSLLDDKDNVVAEQVVWAATPLPAEGAWRGPLFPGSTRHIVADHGQCHHGQHHTSQDLRVARPDLRIETEITEVRVWTGNEEKPAPVAES